MNTTRLRTWWHARESRERQVLMVGALLCVLVLGWLLLWRPLSLARASLASQLDQRQQDLVFMQAAAAQMSSLRTRDAQGHAQREGKSLLALADASARAAHLGTALKRVEPLDNRRVRVEFAGAGFDALAAWLQGLQRDFGIQVEDLSVNRVDGVGLVNAHVTLQEPELQ